MPSSRKSLLKTKGAGRGTVNTIEIHGGVKVRPPQDGTTTRAKEKEKEKEKEKAKAREKERIKEKEKEKERAKEKAKVKARREPMKNT